MANRYIQQDVEERMTLLGISGERERSKFINDALRMELERMEAKQ
jgi:metal-responsive CopG/Arc/MetJ family transcriptional regulator